MANDKKGIWNGGKTNISKEEAMIFRQMEDSYDIDDSEIEFREDLVKREKLMKEEQKNQKIQSKYSLSKKPLHELYNDIDYDKKTPVSGMGGVGGPVQAKKSGESFSKGKSK
jgi:hypothetical protein